MEGKTAKAQGVGKKTERDGDIAGLPHHLALLARLIRHQSIDLQTRKGEGQKSTYNYK